MRLWITITRYHDQLLSYLKTFQIFLFLGYRTGRNHYRLCLCQSPLVPRWCGFLFHKGTSLLDPLLGLLSVAGNKPGYWLEKIDPATQRRYQRSDSIHLSICHLHCQFYPVAVPSLIFGSWMPTTTGVMCFLSQGLRNWYLQETEVGNMVHIKEI